jgi:hypothetical protein
MKRKQDLIRTEMKLARRKWDEASAEKLAELRQLLHLYKLSVALGDVIYFSKAWYVTHAGLLRLARRNRCLGIKTMLEARYSDPLVKRWVFKATVYRSGSAKGFAGYGDADPSNISASVRGCELRIAETRAVNRALRKAYGIGLCSVEELGWSPRLSGANQSSHDEPCANGNNGHQRGQPRLRDRLCLLIRQYRLDAGLVKAYAADFCGTPTLRDASREQVEAFISHLTERASNDREALLCHLNSYPKQEEDATK